MNKVSKFFLIYIIIKFKTYKNSIKMINYLPNIIRSKSQIKYMNFLFILNLTYFDVA